LEINSDSQDSEPPTEATKTTSTEHLSVSGKINSESEGKLVKTPKNTNKRKEK